MNTKQVEDIPETLIQATVKITGQDNNGTGFVCSVPFIENDKYLVVSNRHVLENFKKENTSILLSQKIKDCYTRLCPISNEVYSHPNENIDLACLLAYQNLHFESKGKFHLKTLTPDYFSEQSNIISSKSELKVIGYPKSKSSYLNPSIQNVNLVNDITVQYEFEHHLLIRPSLEEGSSGSPVFIKNSGRFFLFGVVEGKLNEQDSGVIIKHDYVIELFEFVEKHINMKLIDHK